MAQSLPSVRSLLLILSSVLAVSGSLALRAAPEGLEVGSAGSQTAASWDRVSGIEVTNRKTNEVKKLDVQGVFVFIGRTPNTDFARDYVMCDQEGFIMTSACSVETSRQNVFAVGDVRSGNRAQITTAVGDGTIAAFFIRERLEAARRKRV